ncbi:uncharacterized protein DDB_G0284459-like isoform X4 [Pecten maximus]|uniref:uncharacterized protein DDB_G0284459-like isoform X4 n=1 Tax=Pecten maximus TaxID=6579 RepID=UPI0014580310|nr:uncharacterized protein DDB_G0284459-like isoform X4 [Pecten maximus]
MEEGSAGVGLIPLPVMGTIPLPDGSPTPKIKSRKPIRLVRYDIGKDEPQIPLPVAKKDPPKPAKELIAEKLSKKSNSSNMAKEMENKCSSDCKSDNQSLSKLKRSLMQKERNVEGPLEQSIVDEMFKDFLATKMQQIESEYQSKADDSVLRNGQIGEVVSSVEEMNRLLDDELTTISLNTSQKDSNIQQECSQSQSVSNRKHKLAEAKDCVKLETKSKRSKWDMKEKQEKDVSKDRSKPQIKTESVVCVKGTKSSSNLSMENSSKPSSNQHSWVNIESSGVKTNTENLRSTLPSSIIKTVQEKSVTDGTVSTQPADIKKDEDDHTRNVKTNINIALAAQFGKKTQVKKQISLKISQMSAEFISSGERTGKEAEQRKALEDDGNVAFFKGEVISSNDDDSEKHETNDEDSEEEEENNAVSETGSLSDSEKDTKTSKSKKKKKKKNKKHKKKKKHKSSKDQEKNETKRDDSKRKNRSSSRSRSPKRHRDSHSPSRKSRKSRSRSPKWEDRGFDAYDYRETARNRSRDRDRGRGRSRDRSRERSCDRSRDRTRNRSRDRGRDRGRSDRRSRSPEKSVDLRVKIDKAKLREIAIKNVLAMAKSGHGPSVDLTTIKAGGTSVDELTDFCKRISSKEKNRGTESFLSSSSEESEADEKEEEESFIHHPFKVREPSASIVMNIRNAKPLPVLTPQEKITEQSKLRMQFPVSSGSVHRLKEPEWVPVHKTTNALALVTNTPATVSMSAPVSTSMAMVSSTPNSTVAKDTPLTVHPPPSDPPPPPEERVFPETPNMPMDIGTIISERLLAVRKLQENPKDISALSNIANAQKKASMWATSKQLPGQFLGSTGAQILTPEELSGTDKRHQAWAKKVLMVVHRHVSVRRSTQTIAMDTSVPHCGPVRFHVISMELIM